MIRNLALIEDGKVIARIEITHENYEKPIRKFADMISEAFKIAMSESNLKMVMKDFKLVWNK